jgi:thioesterase domain-containing protein
MDMMHAADERPDTTQELTADTSPSRAQATLALEKALGAIWKSALGPKSSDAGGHILHVTFGLKRISRLQKSAETELGVKIPASALLRLGTPKAVAEAIVSGVWPEASPLVLLRDGEDGPALYIPAPGSGVVLELCDLVRLIEFPGRIWGLHLPGIDGECEPLKRIEDIAKFYVDSMRAQNPWQICHVIGYSFGGLVAIEMARLLEANGLQPGLVGVLDSGIYEKFWPRAAWFGFAIKRARRRLAEMRKMPPGEVLRAMGARTSALLRHISRRLNAPKSVASSDLTKSIHYTGGFEPDFQVVRDGSLVAFETYQPSRIDMHGVLFRSALGEPHSCDPEQVWKRVFRSLEIVPVPGSHTTMVRKPNAIVLAAEISRRLADPAHFGTNGSRQTRALPA